MWKTIKWDKKDELKGTIRLGVEFLQWAVMLKRVLEDYREIKILDIDEMSNISGEEILKLNADKMDQYGVLLRASRNKFYSDGQKDYYHDRYKRLFYLANKFGFDYQPRVMVFVEGDTEERVFPQVFEWYIGYKPENIGIEIINIHGISQFFGQKISLKNPHTRKYKEILISNLSQLISYNLNKWQMLPFLICDNEGDISTLLRDGLTVKFNDQTFKLPKRWQYIWGKNNDNKPFKGKDFEFANFDDLELSIVATEIVGKKIKKEQIVDLRKEGKGIKQLEIDKRQFSQKLFSNLFKKYEETKDEKVLDRPIFKLIILLVKLANLNHPPVNTKIELDNRNIIEGYLKENYVMEISKTLSE